VGIGASGDRVAVAQVADDVVRGPVGAPGGGSPVPGPEPAQRRDKPLPLLAEHLEQAAWVEVACAPVRRARWPGRLFSGTGLR
jgi:hypothetical protein